MIQKLFTQRSKDFHPTLSSNPIGYWMLISSHIFWLVPLLYIWSNNFPVWYTVAFFVQILVSLNYHASPNIKFNKSMDYFCANVLIIANFSMLFSQSITTFFITKLIVLLVLIILAFFYFFKSKNYAVSHSIWHALSALITLIVVW